MEIIKDNISVGQYMQSAPPSISRNAKVWEAWRLMKEHKSHFIAIEEEGKIIGTSSHSELQLASSFPGSDRIEVYEVMNINYLEVDKNESALGVIVKLRDSQIHYAHVLEHGTLVGFFSCFDGINFLLEGF